MAYLFSRYLSFGEIPSWVSNGSLGYPTALSLQNSSFYPPVTFLALIGVEYSHKVAVIFQILHVLFGGLGMWTIARSYKVTYWGAVFCAVSFMLSASLFSNSQHVDIIRGAAYVPWVFLVVNPVFISKNLLKLSFIVFILYSFVTASYIGIIISVIYLASVYHLIMLIKLNNFKMIIETVTLFSFAVIVVILLLSIKFLPVLFLKDEFVLLNSDILHGRVLMYNWIAILFDLQSPLIPGDLSMRGLYLSPVVFVAVGIITFKKNLIKRELIITLTLTVLLMSNNIFSDLVVNYLPGANFSRFYISDYKSIMVLFILLLLGTQLTNQEKLILNRLTMIRWLIFSSFFVFLIIVAILNDLHVNKDYISIFLLSLFIPLLCMLREKNEWIFSYSRFFMIGSLFTLVLSYFYWKAVPQVWKNNDFYTHTEKEWGFDFKRHYESASGYPMLIEGMDKRPSRNIYSHYLQAGIIGDYNDSYNSLSYDIGRRLTRNIQLGNLILTDTVLRGFMSSSSRWLLVGNNEELNTPNLLTNYERKKGSVSMVQFTNQGSTFNISLDSMKYLVENEIYYPNWKGEYKDGDGKIVIIEAIESAFGLRAWALPKGKFKLTTYYDLPYFDLSKALSLVGLLVWLTMIGYGVFDELIKKVTSVGVRLPS